MRHDIRFLRRGREVRLGQMSPTLTLLDYLRLHERAMGTKEGCAEGDCGACTVVLRQAVGGRVVYKPVNSCIVLAGQADGCEVITVEDLADGRLHPVQQAMVDLHGSQCGFCTPGFVMALFALYHAGRAPLDRESVNAWLAGNLCRCTGYRPIVDAALASCNGKPHDRFSADESAVTQRLRTISDEDVLVGTPERFFAAPASAETFAELYEKNPDAVILSGATDVGLWITKQMRVLDKLLYIGRVRDLDTISETAEATEFGAAVTHETALPYLARIDPDLGHLMRRFASVQVRSIGTVCGNIANGSPIGDLPPPMLALGATVTLQKGATTRQLALDDFYVAYGKQNRAPGEFVRSVSVPKLKSNEHFRCYKISKRQDQDISAVMGAFKFTLDGSHIASARIAYGGMAAIPKRAREAEARLAGADLRLSSDWQAAIDALTQDFSPIDDMRASAGYRSHIAGALLGKALTEIAGASTETTRVFAAREAADAAR